MQQPLVESAAPKSSLVHATVIIVILWLPMLALNWFTQTEGLKLHDGPEMKLAMQSLMVYFVVWYFIMARQGASRNIVNAELLKSPKATDPAVLAWFLNVDRSFLNMQEQCSMFLASFVSYTLFVDPNVGAYVGFAYSFFTAIYPVLHPRPSMLASTLPRYYFIFYMVTGCFVAAVRS
eukprot:TRINITY_DN3046_c0_g1_i3.p1 TRINITY_DN3046_c0_g1~~TRINITY_DN3046_c0_g1_i3.p1  ORF type:complete len:178 (+),score=25.24 TRINITY_DN3046_c0_g1_i3:67-600(+)